MKKAILIFSFVLVSACATSQERGEMTQTDDIPTPVSDYEEVLEKWTKSDRMYAGLENKFEYVATILSMDVLSSQLNKEAKQYNWSGDDFLKRREKLLQEAQTSTRVFVSFFTPVEENSRLDKQDSVWNIFLVTGGNRISPRSIRRVHGNMAELKQKYPYHNPWSKAFEVNFPVSTETVTQSGAKLVFSGPVGKSELMFP